MRNTANGCAINEIILQHGIGEITMENDHLFISILPDKGADIYQFIYKPKDIDVLWKAQWGLKKPDRGIQTASIRKSPGWSTMPVVGRSYSRTAEPLVCTKVTN